MQNTKGSDFDLLFAARLGQQDLRGTTRKVHFRFVGIPLVVQGSNRVKPSLSTDTVLLFVSGSRGFLSGRGNVRGLRAHLDQGHDAIDQPVDDFKPTGGPRIGGRQLANVAGTDHRVRDDVFAVNDDGIADFKQLEAVGKGGGFVVLKGLEDSRQQRGANHLVFNVGGIRQGHSQIFSNRALQGGKVVVDAAQTVRQDLGVSGATDFFSQQVTH
mmetsp:Transcript_6196/g.12800  ORF Transcript_6196/g.12800 Transcript_6196/m.12800 type:complete len:214 (-) Transcript_6196:1265-1906(-)